MISCQQPMQLAPDVVLQFVGDEALLLKLHDEAVFTLNETGARIALLISEGFTLEAVTQRLSREYEADQAEVALLGHRFVPVLKLKV